VLIATYSYDSCGPQHTNKAAPDITPTACVFVNSVAVLPCCLMAHNLSHDPVRLFYIVTIHAFERLGVGERGTQVTLYFFLWFWEL
jgi:hypothetical protein